MTQYSSLLRGLAAGSAFLFLFAPTAFAAEQTVEAPSVDARAWILMDYEDVIVHLFSQDDRLFYNLEKIWQDGIVLSPEEFE